MAVIRCKMCGGDLVIEEESSVAVCEYCGTKQTVPTADNERKLTLFGRANRLLRNCEFDKASGIYESIVAEFPEEAEVYWCLVLCKYGIEYVDDPATGKKVPTCHRSSFESVLEDKDVELAMEYADLAARRVYRDEAKQIEELRKTIIEVSGKEEPYDIFISYKETDENGDRTLDSVIAQDIYDALTDKGYRVFFSRISLEDKLGTEYEPYIFAALNSANVMLCVGTDYEHFNAVWVKNEWSRFLSLIAKGEKKVLIPVFKNIDAYDMPKEFAKLSAQDMGKVGAMQDLLRGVDKIIGGKQAAVPIPAPVASQQVVQTIVQNGGVNTEALMKRGFMALEDEEWDKADDFFEKVLNENAEHAEAYLGKLMAEMKVSAREKLCDHVQPFDDKKNFKKAIRFGDEKLKAELEGTIRMIQKRKEEENHAEEERWQINEQEQTERYNSLRAAFETAHSRKEFLDLSFAFSSLHNFRDSEKLTAECRKRAELCGREEYTDAHIILNNAKDEKDYLAAAAIFEKLSSFYNADIMCFFCKMKAEILENSATRERLIREYQASSRQIERNAKMDEINSLNRHVGELSASIRSINSVIQHVPDFVDEIISRREQGQPLTDQQREQLTFERDRLVKLMMQSGIFSSNKQDLEKRIAEINCILRNNRM